MYNINELKEFFKNDLFAVKSVGIEIIEANNDYAKCQFKVTPNHMNARGVVMGGALFSLADFTFAVATNQHEEYYTVSTTSNISYMRPAKGNYIYAEAIKLRDGRTICFYDVNIYDDKNELVAKANFSGTHVLKS